MKLPGIVCGLWLLCTGPVTATQVYRCDGPDGAPVFQQTACTGAGSEVQLAAPAARWDPLRPGERAMLDASSKPQQARTPPRPSGEPGRTAAKRASDRSCWQKRQRLAAVSVRLRRGYKPAQGERLRRRRDELAGFISRYCD